MVELLAPHRVFSTSACNGGQCDSVRFLVIIRAAKVPIITSGIPPWSTVGLELYHQEACREIDLPWQQVALMGTAANMHNAALVESRGESVSVTAIVTAGVQGNATCAGDPASWRENESGWSKIPAYSGTINTMLLIDHPVTDGALARTVMTMTEGKTAALQRLAVRSLYSKDPATGTGTDQYCVASPISGGKPLTTASTHVELGELIATAVRDATSEALRWQNGLEPSYTRGLLHAMGRYGFRSQDEFLKAITSHLEDRQLELLRKNVQAVLYEPAVAASVYAFCAVLDRVRYGTIPASASAQVLRQHAALIAVNLSARCDLWNEFCSGLPSVDQENPGDLILQALALGWSSKWT